MPSRGLRESYRGTICAGFEAGESLPYREPIHNNYYNHTAFLNKLTLHSVGS